MYAPMFIRDLPYVILISLELISKQKAKVNNSRAYLRSAKSLITGVADKKIVRKDLSRKPQSRANVIMSQSPLV